MFVAQQGHPSLLPGTNDSEKCQDFAIRNAMNTTAHSGGGAVVTQEGDQKVQWQDEIVFFLNGEKVVVDRADPTLTLVEYLRDNLSFTATKVGCGQGLCGT